MQYRLVMNENQLAAVIYSLNLAMNILQSEKQSGCFSETRTVDFENLLNTVSEINFALKEQLK